MNIPILTYWNSFPCQTDKNPVTVNAHHFEDPIPANRWHGSLYSCRKGDVGDLLNSGLSIVKH